MRTSVRCVECLLCFLLISSFAVPAKADTHWQGGSGAWSEPSNWTNGVPTIDCYFPSSAYIDNGGEAQIDVVLVPESTTVSACDDAFVSDHWPDQTFDRDDYFRALHGLFMPLEQHDYGYVKFDLGSIPANATITGATLRLRVAGKGYCVWPTDDDSFRILEVVHNDWDESTITWINQPYFGEQLFSMLIKDLPAIGEDIDVPIPVDVINTALSIDQMVSFGFTAAGFCHELAAVVEFNSHENVAGPKLRVEYALDIVDAEANFLYLGSTAGNSGTAMQYGGDLVIGSEGEAEEWYPPEEGEEGCEGALIIGDDGTGQFTQHSGTVAVHGLFRLGIWGGQGTYNLSGGLLNVTGYWVWIPDEPEGYWWYASGGAGLAWEGQATFNHTAGTFNVGIDPEEGFVIDYWTNISMAHRPNSVAEYNLSGTGELHASNEWFDGMGTAVFRQTGGTNRVENSLLLQGLNGGNVTYTISSGTLIAESLSIGGMGDATFEITSSDAEIRLQGLWLGGNATFKAVPGSTVHLTGSYGFAIGSTEPNKVEGLRNLEIIFERDYYCDFEVAGKDMGAVITGFDDNFALGTLRTGDQNIGKVRLYDDYDNNLVREGSEVLYVENLILGSGSILDLNGFNLYYINFTDLGGTILLNGGSLIQVTDAHGEADFDDDGDVDGSDLVVFTTAFGSSSGDPDYNPVADFNDDGHVDEADLTVFATNFGQTD